MSVQHLFDSRGEWVAFRQGKYVFDRNGDWIGWLPWNDDDIVDTHGEYLGTIVRREKPRLYRMRAHPYRGYPGYPEYLGYPGYPGYPGSAAPDFPPLGAEDVRLLAEENA